MNLLGLIYCTKAVIPIMKEKQDGLIININSQAGIGYHAGSVIYNTSKWGVTGFTKSLQEELKEYGIRVTDILPGRMKTNIFQKNHIERDITNALDPMEVVRVIRFLMETSNNVIIPEIGIKQIHNEK